MTTGTDVVLDDLTFADLLRITLQDIPGSSQALWTLHGPVDPGVTVLELYCWLFEQRLFMADQTVEPVIRAALRLLGIEDPRPSAAAVTVLAFRAADPPARLPAGTVMNLDRDMDGRAFALAGPVCVLPVTAVAAEGGLRRSGDTLDLVLSVSAVPPAGLPLSLLVDLAAPPGVAPAWSPAAADIPPPAELGWTAVGPGGQQAVQVADGTGGFRRPGLIGLDWPAVWNGRTGCRLRVTAGRASWTEPVRIRGVHANAAVGVHRVPRTVPVDDQLGRFLPLPGQRLRLPEAFGTVCDDPGGVTLRMTESDGTEQAWTSVTSWTGTGPADRVMLVGRQRGELVFGDGRAGRIPRPADQPRSALSYAVGAGPAGNVGAARWWVQDGGAAVAYSPLAADGGADTETIESARPRAADQLEAPDRTVHAADTQALAESAPGAGIARAFASPGFHPGFPCATVPGAITVTVVPYADRGGPGSEWTAAPVPDDGALAAVRARLGRARLIGQEVFVVPPAYRAVSVRVRVSRTARDDLVQAVIVDTLRRFLDPLAGGDDGGGWPFGGVVRPSRLAGVLRQAIGPEATVMSLSVALDDGPATDCADLPIGPRELVWLAAARIDWDAALPPGTGLL